MIGGGSGCICPCNCRKISRWWVRCSAGSGRPAGCVVSGRCQFRVSFTSLGGRLEICIVYLAHLGKRCDIHVMGHAFLKYISVSNYIPRARYARMEEAECWLTQAKVRYNTGVVRRYSSSVKDVWMKRITPSLSRGHCISFSRSCIETLPPNIPRAICSPGRRRRL